MNNTEIKNNPEELLKLRHSAEHLLMMSMRDLGYEFHMAMGPATAEGFYFDFELLEGTISEVNFPKLEKRIKELAKQKLPITQEIVDLEVARKLFAGNPYKQEWLDEIEAKGEKVSLYKIGEDGDKRQFVDLCAGPHLENTLPVKAVKLLSVAGAYWRGSEKNKMLTRIYGTAFYSEEELLAYLNFLEEAKKRDHKKLGKELNLFVFSELVGAGLPLWTPKGTFIRNELDGYVWQLRKERGYEKVTIPHITKKDLYEVSGHWEKFKNDLFRITTRENHEFAMKPMNCPHHTQIYKSLQRSYRDLPQRYAETTMVYRDEQTGELNGLSRVRCITQDDAHVFCRETQLKTEMFKIWEIIEEFYKATGFPKLSVRLSFHDPNNMKAYLGTEKDWKKWEKQLEEMVVEKGVEYVVKTGEAAFYGPKIDFIAQDSLGREWQVATIQADRNMPTNFDLSCVNEEGNVERIVMVHAAIMGSIERFMSILIEHHAGAFPLWLTPTQVAVLPVSDKFAAAALDAAQKMRQAGIRVELDEENKTLGAKIRHWTLQKVPYLCIIGDKEVSAAREGMSYVSVREREKGDLGTQELQSFLANLKENIEKKT